MHRFIALLSLCVLMGLTQSADAQNRIGNRTYLNDRGAARDDRRVMPAPNPRFVEEAVRRAKERRTRMEALKRLGLSLARPTVLVGPAAMFGRLIPARILTGDSTRRRYYGRRSIGARENNSSSGWEYYSSPYLWSPLHWDDREQFPLQGGLQRSPAK